MKFSKIVGWSSALCLSVTMLQAQETSEVDQLKKQLQQMQQSFEKVQREQQQQIEALNKRLEEFTRAQAKPVPETFTAKSAEQLKLEKELAAELGNANASPDALMKKPWRPT